MVIACLGDSLTEGDYGICGKTGIANVMERNYPYFLGEILNAEVRNFGKSGYRSSALLKYYKDGNISVENADYVIIMLGTNGGQDPDNMNAAENLAYRELVELCKNDAPDAKIVLCTPPHVTTNPEYSNCGYAEQVKNAVQFVRKFAKEKNLSIIDVASCRDFTDETEHIMQANDGLHFVEEGYKALAQFIAAELTKI